MLEKYLFQPVTNKLSFWTNVRRNRPRNLRNPLGSKPATVRLSIGTEHIDDIIAGLEHGFNSIK